MHTSNILKELAAANNERAFVKTQNQKLIAKLVAANKKLAFQNTEKAKRANELKIANKELLFQHKEKGKRAAELTIASKELLVEAAEKEKRAAAFVISEDELKKSESQFELMVSNIEDYAIFMLDTHGRVATWNSGAQHMKGYSKEDIIGKPMDIFYTQAAIDSQEPQKNLQQALKYGHYETEGLRVRKDGTKFFANVVFTAIMDGKGKLYGYAKIIKEISDIKKAEQNLKKLNAELEQKVIERTEKLTLSEAFSAGVLNSLTAHIAVLVENGDIVAVNDEWKRFASQNGDATLQNTCVGINYYAVCKKAAKENIEEADIVAVAIKEIMDGKKTDFYLEYPCHSPTEKRWFALRVVKFEDNQPMVVVTHQNITERKQAEDEVKRLASRLLLATESVQLGIWDWDIAGDVHIWNNYMYSIYNIDEGQCNPLYEEWLSRLHAEDKQRVADDMQLALAGRQIYQPEFRVVWKDASVHYIKASGIVERDGAGNAIRMISANWDITEQKVAEKTKDKVSSDIVQRNTDLQQFSYIVSHNLRAPIANILGLTAIINDPSNGTEVKNKMIVALASSAKQLDDIIRDLNYILQVKREMTDRQKWVQFSQIIDNIKKSISNIIKSEKVEIKTDFFDVDTISTTNGYLYSIFYNLITNSIKYRQPGKSPEIEIKSLRLKGKIILIFKDNGLGIDLEKSGKQVFGLYKRFHTHAYGKGMGLYMVKTQVEMLGGKIYIQSEINKGTEFRIEFGEEDLTI